MPGCNNRSYSLSKLENFAYRFLFNHLWHFVTTRYVRVKCQNKSSHERCSIKNRVLKNVAKFTGIHLCQSLFFFNFIKKDTLAQVFSCEFCEILKNTFFTEHLWTTASVRRYLSSIVSTRSFSKVSCSAYFTLSVEYRA